MSALNSSDDQLSGNEFFHTRLENAYLNAIKLREKLEIDLTGPGFIASAFLRGSLGQLAQKYGKQNVLKEIEFYSPNLELRIDDAIRAINKGWQGS